MKALRIVYGDEVIVVQCVPRQVVKGKGVLIKVYRTAGLWPLYRLKHRNLRGIVCAENIRRWIYQQLRDFREQQTHCSASVCQRRKPLLSR